MRVARPRARARQRFRVGPWSTRISAISMSSATRSWLFSALAAAESMSLRMSRAARGGEIEELLRLGHGHAAHLVGDQARLARGDAQVAGARAHHRRLGVVCRQSAMPSAPCLQWPRKVRVGANSPSLWPTIDSEMNTGTCLRPSWTAMVWPDHLGEDGGGPRPGLDHVLLVRLVHRVDAPHQPLLDERALLRGAAHRAYLFFFPRLRPRTIIALEALPFLRVR